MAKIKHYGAYTDKKHLTIQNCDEKMKDVHKGV